MPNATVAWSTSPQVHPASARTVWFSGLTVVLRSSDRSMTRAPSHTPEAGGAVAAAPDGDLDAVLAGEPHAGNDVGRVPAAHDGRWTLVDHGVVDGARLVIPGSPGVIRSPRTAAASSSYGAVVTVAEVVMSCCPLRVRHVVASRR
jgi:hypothetical protein